MPLKAGQLGHRDLKDPRIDPLLQIQRHPHKKEKDCTQFQQTNRAKGVQGCLSEGLSGFWRNKAT